MTPKHKTIISSMTMTTRKQQQKHYHRQRHRHRQQQDIDRRTMTTQRTTRIVILFLLLCFHSNQSVVESQQTVDEASSTCLAPKPSVSEAPKEYIVGSNTWHIPVLNYLSKYVGEQFDPPISFRRVTANGYLKVPKDESMEWGDYDFMIANPYASSCYQSENQAISLATQIRINYNAHTQQYHNLTHYGATLYVLNNRTDIQSLEDIKDKKIGTNKITSLATHLCYDVLLRNGIHHLQDPQQTIFFKNSDDALEAVLNGQVDIGCAATNTLENYLVDPATNELLDIDSTIRVLHPQHHTVEDGSDFPYEISSVLVPGYQFQVFPHVPQSVTSRVQTALLAMRQHADIAPSLLGCMASRGCQVNQTFCVQECFEELPSEMFQRCDTTPTQAVEAFQALNESGLVGFSQQSSNLQVRDIQERTGSLVKENCATSGGPPTSPSSSLPTTGSSGDDSNGPRCVRMTNIVDAVTCPYGHFVRSTSEIVQQCNVSALPCYGRDCICSPCVEAYEVDFFPVEEEEEESSFGSTTDDGIGVGSGCSKFSVCGQVQQSHTLTFRAIDNRYKERPDSTMTGAFLLPDESELPFNFTKRTIANTASSSTNHSYFEFHFIATNMNEGQKTIKIRINNQEIPESPFRINVVKRDCAADTGNSHKEANEYGQCVCKDGMVQMGDRCVYLAILIPTIFVVAFIMVMIGVHCYVQRKKDQADNIWKIDPDELLVDDPPRVLGRGTFGLVLLAEYRGTPVAVKQVLPSSMKENASSFLPSHVEFKIDDDKTGTNNLGAMSALGMASRSPHKDEVSTEIKTGIFAWKRNKMIGEIVVGVENLKEGVLRKRNSAQIHHSFIEEIRLLSRLRHPAITTVMGAVIQKKLEPLLVMEYMHFGSLHDLLQNESMILEGDVLIGFLQDVASGLRFLHSSEPLVLHGDLKSQNILVDDKFRAKVADFGCGDFALARHKGSSCIGKARGTPYWMAPELLRGETANTKESDIYAFGIVMYEVFSRKEPYSGEPYSEVMRLVSSEQENKRPPVPDCCPSEAAKMMKACLKYDPNERPSAAGLDICLRWMDGSDIKGSANITPRQVRKSEASSDSRANLLIEEMFPSHIAEALREGRKVEPESHEEVTIVFSDIVGYTDITSSMSDTKVSDLLDRLYNKLDELCERLEVFKVETIGNTFMVVTNLVKSQPNHVSLAARFAVEALLVASTVSINVDDPPAGFVRLRVGFHTGPVVTHVIGSKNARFTLIGDTVTTASKMESLSLPGKIQCSENSYSLLAKNNDAHMEFTVRKRGKIEVNGKGDMVTYWIEPGDGRLESC